MGRCRAAKQSGGEAPVCAGVHPQLRGSVEKRLAPGQDMAAGRLQPQGAVLPHIVAHLGRAEVPRLHPPLLRHSPRLPNHSSSRRTVLRRTRRGPQCGQRPPCPPRRPGSRSGCFPGGAPLGETSGAEHRLQRAAVAGGARPRGFARAPSSAAPTDRVRVAGPHGRLRGGTLAISCMGRRAPPRLARRDRRTPRGSAALRGTLAGGEPRGPCETSSRGESARGMPCVARQREAPLHERCASSRRDVVAGAAEFGRR
mmetsp:Transcript_7196/g.20421  ORF Transcript_7196/g.20421 Transcript_7196/m.20421 type:complete len:256 (+) Transcript_7196:129-896(+)